MNIFARGLLIACQQFGLQVVCLVNAGSKGSFFVHAWRLFFVERGEQGFVAPFGKTGGVQGLLGLGHIGVAANGAQFEQSVARAHVFAVADVDSFKNVFIVSISAVNYRYEQKNLPKRYQSRAICASPSLAGKCP